VLLSPAPSSTSLPPGPRHGAWWQTARLVHDAEGYLAAGVARYGDPFAAPIRDGMVVFTGRRDLVKAIFSAPTDVIAPYAPEHIASVLGPHALILLTGGRHKHERSMVMPLFHGEHLHAWTQTMVDVTRAHLRGLPPGDVVVLDLCQRIALDVVLRTIFGFTDEVRHREILDLTLAFLGAVHPLAIFFDGATKKLPDAMKLGRLQRWPIAKARLAAFLQDEIARRRRPDHAPGPTVIDTFLQLRFDDGSMLSDDDVADQLRTFLVTGHETTAGAMAWAIDAVFRDPAIHARLQDELATVDVDDGEALARLPYLGAVVDEALRLHPVIPYVPKRTVQPFELDGHQLPIGTGVFVTAALAHMDPAVFPDPTRFRPERFLEHKPTATEYFPFGGGVKRCLASAFATHEMRIVLGTIVARHRFATRTGPLRPVHHGISRGPAGRGPLTNLGPVSSSSPSLSAA
jgi:cytochrome P450 family 110